MKQLPKRRFTAEFRQEAIRLVQEAGVGVTEAARRLQLSPKTLGNWVYATRRVSAASHTPAGSLRRKAPVSELQMRVSQLEAENARLKMEREILKKATAFFAKEST
jgi:transposase